MELTRFLRDRSNIFFVFIFPLLLVAMIGLQFGDDANAGRAAVVGSGQPLQERIVERLEEREVVVSSPTWDDALEKLARGRVDVAVRIDDAAASADAAGEPVRIEVVRSSAAAAQVVEQELRAAVAGLGVERSQQAALVERGVAEDEAAQALAAARTQIIPPTVKVSYADDFSQEFDGMGQFDFGASGQLLLFVFLTTLNGASTMIQARRLGVVRRMMSTPISSAQLIVGSTLGRWVLGFFQGAYIMAASTLFFGVDWGNLALALLVLAVFALVAAGAATLIGTLLNNEGPATGIAVGSGLVLAALGGSMFPLELMPDTMRKVAWFVPHSWGYEALADITRRGGGLVDIAPPLGVLLVMAVVLLVLGAWSLRRSLARAM
ncbi:ABC transporter permease [Nocardioides daphniae]|uniref:ABC transporter permease n=1 Tax=Nocardioides daphniae TaxID=402297 RepID=A0A4P7UKZ0_9ACTN|nr:ABC transporter permease [Nocardioides daphniae]